MKTNSFLVAGSLLICAVGLASRANPADQIRQGEDWPQLIVSADSRDRTRGERFFVQQRGARIATLLQLVDSPVEEKEGFYQRNTARNIAIRLLGQLRAPEAVLPLARRLIPKTGQESGATESLSDLVITPAGDALVEIGTPAVPAVVDILATVGVSSEDKGRYIHEERGGGGYTRRVGPPLEHSSHLGDQCLRILVYIKGLEETEAGLRREIAAETAESRKKNLEQALAALSRPSVREGFQSIQAQKEAREHNEWRGWWKKQEEEQARKKALQPHPEPQPAAPAN